MKKVTNLLAIAVLGIVLLLGSNAAKAQTTPANALRLGIGLETGVPMGNASNVSDFEIGGTARLQYGITNNFALTLTSGYYDMIGKQTDELSGKDYQGFQIIPLKFGLKEFFAPHIYFGAEAGAAFVTNTDGHTKLDLSPALGYASKSWDVGLRYENFSGQGYDYGLLGLRIAYGFGL